MNYDKPVFFCTVCCDELVLNILVGDKITKVGCDACCSHEYLECGTCLDCGTVVVEELALV